MWIIAAVFSAIFAGLTSVLAKRGIKNTDSDVATALRTIVVVVFSWVIAFVANGANFPAQIGLKSFLFLVLSGVSTGASWICYFKALSLGDVNKVVPIDKSSTIITVILAIVLFGETNNLAVKLSGTVLLAIGIFLMTQKQKTQADEKRGWFVYAAGSAIFAALTSILAKIGIENVESNLATAVRTSVVLVMSWVVVFVKGKADLIKTADKTELSFVLVSGIMTGASWLCYYYALQNGIVSVVVPIDKLSIVVSVALSAVFFHEKLSKRALAGLSLMVIAAVSMAVWA